MERKNYIRLLREKCLKLCLFIFLSLFSSSLIAQITVNVQNKPIKEVLKVIESKSEYRFFFNEGLIGLDKTVTLQVNNAGIDETMKLLLHNSEIAYKTEGNNLVMLMAKLKDNQSVLKNISGVVLDENGESIIGASVLIKGTNTGTITNVNGQFSLDVSEKSILAISYVGYQPQEVPVAGKNSFQITLKMLIIMALW